MTAPRIRLAQPSDVAELRILEEIARSGIAVERGGERLLEVTPARADQWFVEGYVTLVALIDDVPVGFLSMRTGEISFIEGVFVHPDAREVGCGDALVDKARSIAKESGGRRLEAIALPGDRETKNLYERAAITAKAITVAIDLSDPSS
ncbi:MAG: GNAT family N-acetyltransferase [Ilumatobacteraceae bacterium]|nr:GNAT family N-acetyltransferase [Ilumatobacteraceae bacterium]